MSLAKHPADDDQPKQHPHVHNWVPVKNDWDETIGYQCECGVWKPA